MQKTKWILKESSPQKEILSLADSLNISNILANLLIYRGVTNFYEAKAFFRPSLDMLHDPYLMDGMDEASNRVIAAITNNEKIVIYGDYDVDGTCSTALMYLFLKEFNADVEMYIPNRLTDGYGLSLQGIDFIKERGCKLMITVDCGITAVEEVDYASSLGIETIICDHHKVKDDVPKAVAVLDPIKPGCTYPFKHLSGAGVAFKLARAVGDKVGKKELALKYLDLVALAGAADIVSLTGENRVLVRRGIEQINTNPRPGIKALILAARMDLGFLTAGQIVFSLAPRINAVGRMGEAIRAVQLFVTDDEKEAIKLATVLEAENVERRKIDEATFSHALQKAEKEIDLKNDIGIVLHDDNWHPGVIGIVASRMVEKFYRPAVMLSTIDGVAKGSARSISGFNVYKALQECEDLLIQYGGHEAAAGLAIEIEKIDEFRLRFNRILKETIKEKDIIPETIIDSHISFGEITPKFMRILDEFSPFGPGNMRPVFMATDVRVLYPPRLVGGSHLILYLKQDGCDKMFDSIGFSLGNFASAIDYKKDLVDIVFTLEKVTKDGRQYPQLRLKDLKVKKG
ncbi:MAG: single-stranded-DNA-specific exonuclease RecJ [Ignavibacteria bacterium]|nr:single-stranded-DNA-specific exonuclease RecJ [Ignavibacteria bacterium]